VNGRPDGAGQGGGRPGPQREAALAAAPLTVAAVQGEAGADRQETQMACLVFSLGHDLAGQSRVAQVDERPRWGGLLLTKVASPLSLVRLRPLVTKRMSVPDSQLPLFDIPEMDSLHRRLA
jgi:hypothetical protein